MPTATPLAAPSEPLALLLPAVSPPQVIVETVADGLDHPWAVAFLPDGTLPHRGDRKPVRNNRSQSGGQISRSLRCSPGDQLRFSVKDGNRLVKEVEPGQKQVVPAPILRRRQFTLSGSGWGRQDPPGQNRPPGNGTRRTARRLAPARRPDSSSP